MFAKSRQLLRTGVIRPLKDYRKLLLWKKYGSHNHSSKTFYRYWQYCVQNTPPILERTTVIDNAVKEFKRDGVTSWSTTKSSSVAREIYSYLLQKEKIDSTLWDDKSRLRGDVLQMFPAIEDIFHNSLSEFLYRIYNTQYEVFTGILQKSVGTDEGRKGSALWHCDLLPGTCIIVMYAISPVTKDNDALSVVSQKHTIPLGRDIFSNRRKLENSLQSGKEPHEIKNILRKTNSNLIDRKVSVKTKGAYTVIQPVGESGLIIPFRNSSWHRGGNPKSGETRYVCIFHVYPSITKPDWSKYRKCSLKKTRSYPETPEL